MMPATHGKARTPERYCLFTTHQPIKQSPKYGNIITKWVNDDKDKSGAMQIQIYQSTGNEALASLAVR